MLSFFLVCQGFRAKVIKNSFEYDFLEEKYSESVFAITSFRYCGFRSMRVMRVVRFMEVIGSYWDLWDFSGCMGFFGDLWGFFWNYGICLRFTGFMGFFKIYGIYGDLIFSSGVRDFFWSDLPLGLYNIKNLGRHSRTVGP